MNDIHAIAEAATERSIKIHGSEAFEGMRKAGQLAAETLDYLVPFIIH
jgi:methionyl aminopeptidase